jgi:hypothetical protein
MASRKEQKEALRKEREEREAVAKAEQRRRQLIGYAAGGVVALIAVVVAVVILAGSGGGGSGGKAPKGGGDVLPGGGSIPAQKISDLTAAAKAAGCELKSYKGKSREHTGDLSAKITYDSDPPTEGKHFQVPADDGAYQTAPDKKQLVHTLEHGRVIIWFKKSLPRADRAGLKKLFDEDSYHMVLTPDDTMPYAVAATAWNQNPQPNGTGRLMGCTKFTPAVYDALRAFKDEHRDNGPEPVP